MTRKLSKLDEAYNACIEALNDAEDKIEALMATRQKAWDAAEAIHALGKHGKRGSTADDLEVEV